MFRPSTNIKSYSLNQSKVSPIEVNPSNSTSLNQKPTSNSIPIPTSSSFYRSKTNGLNHNHHESNVNNRNVILKVVPCLYSKHKLKKRKTWSDGYIQFKTTGNLIFLYDGESPTNQMQNTNFSKKQISLGHSLESRAVTSSEMECIRKGQYVEIEFENYLVTIEEQQSLQSQQTQKVQQIQPTRQPPILSSQSLRKNNVITQLGKFKLPSTIVRVEKEATNTTYPHDSVAISTSSSTFTKKVMYSISDNELDDIWGDSPQKTIAPIATTKSPVEFDNLYDVNDTKDSEKSNDLGNLYSPNIKRSKTSSPTATVKNLAEMDSIASIWGF